MANDRITARLDPSDRKIVDEYIAKLRLKGDSDLIVVLIRAIGARKFKEVKDFLYPDEEQDGSSDEDGEPLKMAA